MEMSVAPRVALRAAASSSKLTRPLRATASSSNKLRGRGLSLSCCLERVSAIRCRTRSPIMKKEEEAAAAATGLTVVMKFGGSSMASAERMKEVADLILSFPDENPVIVLSAMGKTTNNLLLAGEKAVSCGALKACEIPQLSVIKELHLKTIDELGLDRSIVSGLLDQLEQLLKGIAMMKELTLRTRDYLVSFGECMSTRIFAAYMNKLGIKVCQYDAFNIGFITTNDFTNADILEVTYPTVAKRLLGDWIDHHAIPIITGSPGKGCKSSAVTTLGKGGTDLTATTIGKALGLRVYEDGVLTYANVTPVPYSLFDKAVKPACAQVLLPQTMQLPSERGNLQAPGTIVGNPTPLMLGKEYSACVTARPGIASLRNKSYVGQYQRRSGSINIRLSSEDAVLKIINYEDLKILRELGSGAFGTVHLAELRGVGNVAVKFLNSNCYASGSPTQEEREEFLHEARALSKLRHPNVLQFLGVVVDGPGGTLAIVTEFLADGSLWKVSRCKDKCLHDEHKKLKIATDIASAMKYVHSENFVHFDLKGGNLLIDLKDENCPICKVADFGLSKIKKNALISGGMRGTLQWMAPEVLDGFIKVSEKVDVYSYGIVLWEIEAEMIPYWGMDRDAIKDGVMSGRLRPLVPAHCGPEMKRLMESCWAHDPEQRPTFTEILTQLEVMSATAKYTKTMEN